MATRAPGKHGGNSCRAPAPVPRHQIADRAQSMFHPFRRQRFIQDHLGARLENRIHRGHRLNQYNAYCFVAGRKLNQLLEKRCCFFDVIVQDNRIVAMLGHLYQRDTRFCAVFEIDLEVLEHPANNVRSFFVTADQKATEHNRVMLGGYVTSGKLPK